MLPTYEFFFQKIKFAPIAKYKFLCLSILSNQIVYYNFQ